MIAPIKAYAHRFIVTLRVGLLTMFVTLFAISMVALFSISSFNVSFLVKRAAFLLVDKEAAALVNDLTVYVFPIQAISELTTEIIQDGVLSYNEFSELQTYLMRLVKKFPLIHSAYWGDREGNFIYAREEKEKGPIILEMINKRNPALTSATNIHFDPRERPWFKAAVAKNQLVWTDIYEFAPPAPPHLGITVASPATINGRIQGVFGMDIRLDYLSRYVNQHKISKEGEVFIVNNKGELIASPLLLQINPKTYYKKGILSLGSVAKPYARAFELFQKNKESMFLFEKDNETYIAVFRKIPYLEKLGWYIAVIDRESDFTAPIRRFEATYLLINLAIFFLSLFFISNLVTRVVRPIKKLVKETEKIKDFDLSPGEPIHSRIKEVIELSDAIDSMKMGLRSFQKYVPASLVRQLIEAGEDVTLGAHKREIVILFSDIKNFAAITEHENSNELVNQLFDYFNTCSFYITEEKGTIDKYIGDSIMAFWGAPLTVSSPYLHAVKAAFRCMKALQLLNKNWVAEGKSPFVTRIGLHAGEAVVGNIGSSERLNYTALGDVVNIASRLESANKYYGTSILVSEAVEKNVNDQFILRFVDKVVLKGKVNAIEIYELLAESEADLAFNLEAYQTAFNRAYGLYQQASWREAKKAFEACIKIYPNDCLAPIFIERCEWLTNHPPLEWKGIWILSEK